MHPVISLISNYIKLCSVLTFYLVVATLLFCYTSDMKDNDDGTCKTSLPTFCFLVDSSTYGK